MPPERDVIRIADVAGRHALIGEEVERRVIEVLRSGRYIGGPVVAEAEAAAARWFDRKGAVGVNSGTDALILALQAVGVRPGDEVIIPALSFFATAGAVCAAGATPVICDVRPDATIDLTSAAEAQSSKTTAVVPVHLYGTQAHRPDLGVPVVDDAAQAIGGIPSRSNGDLSSVSTYPTKTWGAAGDGGFVVGDDPELLTRVRRIANHGMRGVPHEHHTIEGLVGRNTRLDAIQAAVLLAQEARLGEWADKRRAHAARYDAELPDSVRPLDRGEGSPVHQYVALVDDRASVLTRLEELGVHAGAYYPMPMHHQAALAGRCRATPTPNADHIAAHCIALPVHERLTPEEIGKVITAMHRAVGAS